MSTNTQVKTYRGQGKLLRDGKVVCTGTYHLTRRVGPDEQPDITGTFVISGVPSKELGALLKTLGSQPPYCVLEIKDGRKFDISLEVSFEPQSTIAVCNIRFLNADL